MKKDMDKESDLHNTLDYYDEAITINAVGRLVNKPTTDGEISATEDKSSFVRGFERDIKEEDPRDYLYSNKTNYEKPKRTNEQKREVKYPQGYKAPVSRGSNSYNKSNTHNSEIDAAKNNTYDREISVSKNKKKKQKYELTKMPIFKMGVFLIFFIFLSTLAFLVYRINTVTSQLEYMQASEMVMQQQLEVDSLIEERDELAQQVIALETIVGDLQDYVEAFYNLEEASVIENDENISQGTTNQHAPNATIHIVQPGENLSRISQQFYGTRNEFQRIIDANNLQTDTLYVGQELIIP